MAKQAGCSAEFYDISISVDRWSAFRYWPPILVFSLLFHAALLRWVEIPTAPDAVGPVIPLPLRIRIEPPVTAVPAEQASQERSTAELPPATAIGSEKVTPPATASKEPPISARQSKPQSPPSTDRKELKDPSQEGLQKAPTHRPAAGLLERSYESLPGILDSIDRRKERLASPGLFEPGFRRRLAEARAEAERLKELQQSKGQQAHIEYSGVVDDYLAVRIGDRCWQVPLEGESGPTDLRIWRADPHCPRRQKISFSR